MTDVTGMIWLVEHLIAFNIVVQQSGGTKVSANSLTFPDRCSNFMSKCRNIGGQIIENDLLL